MHGNGTYTWANGTTFTGTFRHNKVRRFLRLLFGCLLLFKPSPPLAFFSLNTFCADHRVGVLQLARRLLL